VGKSIPNQYFTRRTSEKFGLVGALAMEILPFNVIPPDQGYKAIIEYVIWREHPEESNAGMVKDAVLAGIKTMREAGGTDVVDGLRKGPFAWNSLLP